MIDILLSTYNGEKFLSQQLDSLFSQTYKDFKIIVRDDGSTDNTLAILELYKQKNPEKIFLIENHKQNLRSTGSFLTLLKYSSSELIMFCDQDDFWNSNKLELMYNYYRKNIEDKTKPILVHSIVDVVDEKLKSMDEESATFNNNKCGMEKTLCWQILQNDVTGCTVMINSVLKDLICNTALNYDNIIQHDWFLANIAFLYGTKYFLPIKTIKYRQHSNNVISAIKTPLIQRITLKVIKGINYPYYKHVSEVLKVVKSNTIGTNYNTLSAFSDLYSKPKILRVIWHLKNNFLREGSFFLKFYQLIAC